MRMPCTPVGCEARQVLPAPGVPAGGGAHFKPTASHAASVPALQHSALAVQRQNPESQMLLAQSLFSRHPAPANLLSTPLASSMVQAMPFTPSEHARFDGATRSARKFPSVSATTGFSYQVHDEVNWLNKTRPSV